jgi:hypothetical protein
MAKAEEPVTDLYCCNTSACFLLDDGREVSTHPGLLAHRDSAIRRARPALFEPLVLCVEGIEDLTGQAAVVTVLAVGDLGDLGHGNEMIRTRRVRVRAASEWLSA